MALVRKSVRTTVTRTDQNSGVLALPLCIFLTLLAVNAVTRVGKRVQTIVGNILAAVVTLSERFGRAIKPSQCFVEMPQKPAFLAGEKKSFLALHRIGSLIRHVERVRAEVAVCALRRRPESFVIMPELLQHSPALLEKPLLEVVEILLRHWLRLLRGCGCCHLYCPL